MKKRILAMLLAIVILVGALPINAFATEATDPAVVLCETEGCEYASGHEGNCSNYVAPTEACATEGCTYGANHEGNCSNYVAPTEVCTTEGCTYGANHEGNCSNFVACETEGCEYVSDHEGNCSNYVAPTEACATEGCTYGANHEGNCSNYVAPTEVCTNEGCTFTAGHEGDCSNAVASVDDVVPVSVTVSFAAQENGEFLAVPQLNMQVSSDTAENYGFTDQTDQATQVSTIDVLVTAHAVAFGDSFTKDNAKTYLNADGNFITVMFGSNNGGNVCLLVNGFQPGSNGVEQAVVSNGDLVEFFVYQNASYQDKYVWLTLPDGTKADGQNVYGGKTVTVVAKGYSPFSYGYEGDEGETVIAGATIYMVDIATGKLTSLGVTTGEDGTASITVPESYVGQTVYLAAKGTEMAMTLAKVKVVEPPASTACNLTAMEIAVGGNTVDAATVQTLTPDFEGATTEYSTPILDYESDKNNRFVWVKVTASEGTTVTAKCGSSNVTTLTSDEWGVLQVQGGYFWSPTYSGPLTPGEYNKVVITVSKEGETDKVYTVTVPMQSDISNRSLAWNTDLTDAIYYTKNAEDAALTVEAQYQNRPLENTDVVTYQWYSNTTASTEGGTAIEGATAATYKPNIAELGTSYYYVVASCKDLDSITSNVIAVTVTDEAAPTSVTIVCDYPYTIPNSWAKALGGVSYVAKAGDTLQLKAVDENGKETPVVWLNTSINGGTLDKATGVYTITSTAYSYVQVASLYDSNIKSEEKVIQVVDYSINQYNKTPSITLATDGQSFNKVYTQGGVDTYTIWSYTPSADNVAELTTDLTKKTNRIEFIAMRPGTIEVSFDLDLNGDGIPDGNGQTDTATLAINGIAVEDASGALTKTYLEISTEAPNPTMQLKALSSTENAACTWSSADETIATVDEYGLVTAQGVGSVIISANDGTYTGGIKVVVTSAETPYFEQIDFTTTSTWGTGLSSATWKTATFKPTVLEYTGLSMTKAAANTLTLKNTTLYNTDKYTAVASYTDANGENQSVTINSGAVTELKNIPFDTNIITITLTDKTDETKKTVYTFEVTRPRDTVKSIANNGIVFVPDGRAVWKDQYDGKTEGIMYVANEDGSFAQYQGVNSSRLYYRTYALNGLEAFALTLKGSSAYTHIRFSTDDGTTWTYLGQTGASGVSTGKIAIPAPTGEEHSVVKVTIQILDDATYAANIAAEKNGFADAEPKTYTLWVEQIPELSAECNIVTAVTDSGDWYPTFDESRTSYRIVVAPEAAAPVLTFTVSEGAKVTIGDTEQTPDENGEYTLTLTSSTQSIVVAASDGMTTKTYSFGYSERESIYVPDKVVDFLNVNGQYINGGSYGSSPQQTLTGGLLSLGNFGGYVTFYLEDGLTDNPNNAYGVDFYVNGNAFKDTSTGTGLGSMEPGQVWVSEDGSTWYALAGSEHYEPSTIWNYSVTYTKTETGGTSWSDNYGNTDESTHGRSFAWPSPEVYTMNDLATRDSFTLTGILIPCVDGTITGTDSFNSFSKGGRFGYVDLLPNGTANPYLDNSNYSNASSGFDLAWAVDGSGNPVDVSGMSFHYVKVVTASNLMAGAANEKSTEVANLVRATAQGNAVGVTAAPSGVTFTSGETTYTVNFEEGKQVYEVEIPYAMQETTILINGTAEGDNIYINNQRVSSGTASSAFKLSKDSQKLVRIIVQNGEKAPVIYLLKLTYNDTAAEPVDVTMTVSNKGTLALANGTVTVKDTNADGILTYHEALEAVHAAYCEGGYTATESEWGISVSEIWGVATYNSLYFRNGEKLANHVGNTETSTVAEGDYLVVSVNKDDKYYGDRYSSFNATTKNVVVGKDFTLTLKADLSTGSTVVPNATIGTWNNGVFTPLEGKITNDKGQVTLSFAETGTYIISASGTVSDTVQDWSNGGAEVTADCPLIAPVCVVTVVEAPRLADLRVSKVWADSGDYYEMTPAFDPYVTEYTVHVPDYTSSIFPYVTQAETNVGTRTAYYCCVRGFGMFGWTTSNNISLSSNTYFGAVIYGTSSTSMSDEDIRYTVNISKYATLKSLDVDGTAIIDFDRGINDGAHYYVDGTAEGVKMTPTAHNAAYTVTINGTSVTSGSEYTLPYTWDENGQMEVSITVSGTSVEENTYTLVLEKMPLNDAPFIMKEGTEADYTVIDDASTVEALFVTASANGELAYQWYYNTTESNENGILIEGATASTYTPPITEDVIGTRYYYCVVTNTGKTEGNTTASTATRITVDPDPTPVAVITNPGSELTGFAWDTGYVYNVGDTSTTLNVTASSKAEGGELSYRWFVLDKAYNGGRTYINSEDAYAAGYAPSTEVSAANTDGKYYGCQVTYAFKGKNYTSWATTGKTVTEGEGEDTKTYDVTGVYVFIKVNKAEVPEITRQPASATYLVGKNMSNLRVNASVADGGKLTYQWYVNDTNSTEGGTAIEGATTTSYKLGTATEIGTKYYYCVVTNTIQGYTSSAVSEVAEITVQAAQNVIGEKLSGSGTEEDPFLIVDAQDYQDVYDFVAGGQNFEGLYLKQTGENITLPENWTPIGTSKTKFSGTLDGNGKTVTVPEDGLPLFGYVNGATVKNLNIYGKKIAGYGLVNNLEGVGMSGEAICIDNVTLKSGSSTLKSGLIGTYITSNMYAGCSATYYVTIKNCTIEEGVVIGYNKDQSMIGSFAGRVHGTIENCVSYATVYGKDYVGGIVGTQDNALGGTVITDSQFHGKVEAMGQHAGGIAGGGYSHSSGPNGNKININDCTVTGTITGADKVGGIIGGDTYVAQLWGGHSLKNNSFTGTVKATAGTYVGGIIGFYDSLNKYDDISGNYYKAGCGAAKGIGFVQYVDTNSQTHETQSGAVYFNTGDSTEECPTVAGCGWKAGHNRTDDPLGADAAKLCYTDTDTDPIATELKVSGTYKTEYTTGEKLDLTGIVLTVVYNDKSEKTINLSDATVTGYDANKVGEQELTISYNGLTAAITVKVENPKGEIKVTVAIYGDSKHGDNGTVHTLAGGGLTTWVSATTYTVDSNSTVWDVLQKAFADNGITCNAGSNNSQGTVYISALTRNGVTLAEFDNGTNSGWMYTLNGNHSDNGVAQQYLKDGDKIVFHYTDDYTKEQGSEGNDDEEKDAKAAEAVEKLIDAIGTVTLNSADEIAAAREAYDNLTYAQKQLVDNYAKLTAAETKYAELKAADDEKKAAAVEKLIDKISAGSTTFEDDVKAAQKAYNALTADQKKLVDNYSKLANALKELADEEDKEAAEAVEKLIKDLGTITLESEDDIKAAREAYDKLTDEQKALVENLADLEAAEEKLAQLKADAVTEDIYKTTGDYIEKLGTPVPGSVGGEWMVIGLIRSDREVPGADDYYASVVKYVQENIDENERLHSAKSTDNSRIILAMTAMGKDVTNVDGHNLLNGLNDMAFIQKQGINGPIWALIAFDSGNYPTPEGDVTREALIQVILDAQLADGGWALSGETSDADITGMAVQALAPYYENNADVKKALDEAIATLSKMQAADGSYGSIDGTSSESIAQVIVALAALGIDADKDERFIKNGISALDALCAFYVQGGGFKHLMDGNLDGMATEQGYYALVAYFRMLDDKTSLYNMTDVMDMGGDVEVVEPTETLPAETEPAPTEPVQVEDDDKGGFPWWIIIALLIAGAVVVVIVNRKKIFASVR